MRNERVKCDNILMVLHFCIFGSEKFQGEMVFNSENLPKLHDVMSQTFLIYRNTNDCWLICCSPLFNIPSVVLIQWVIGKSVIFTPKINACQVYFKADCTNEWFLILSNWVNYEDWWQNIMQNDLNSQKHLSIYHFTPKVGRSWGINVYIKDK